MIPQAIIDKYNDYQRIGIMHPLTCDRKSPECEKNLFPGDHSKDGVLIATSENWVCPCGKYTQSYKESTATGFVAGIMENQLKDTAPQFKFKQTITMAMLEFFEPGSIICAGQTFDNAEGLNIDTTGKVLKWIARVGNIGDWAVYTRYTEDSWELVNKQGLKVRSRSNLENILIFTDEVYSKYRK